jgi:DNA helicase HerA-like ATPase
VGSGGFGVERLDIALGGLTGYVVREIPRRGDADLEAAAPREGADPDRAQRVAALVAAYHQGVAGAGGGRRVAFGWVRGAAGGPVRVIAAGDALVGGVDDRSAEVFLSLPAGARARALAHGELAGLAGGLPCWREVAGISDGLLIAEGRGGDGGARGEGRERGHGLSLDDGLLGSWTGAFGWLVVAEPLAPAELEALAEEAGRRERLAAASADRFPEREAQARRLKERHAELRRGVSDGFWRIRVAVGAANEVSAARVAGLFCAVTDLSGLPYALSPAARPSGTPGAPGTPGTPGGDGTAATPFYGSTALFAALARPPEREVPGVRFALRADFDVTPEEPADEPASSRIHLGQVLDGNRMPAGPFNLSAGSLNRHVFVCGATGAGKSQTVRCLLESATERGIPWLVVEPAKAEYRLMASRLPGTRVIRIRPGEPDAIAAGLNPLEPATLGADGSFPLQTHADLVKALFIASFQAEEPFPQVLSAALGRVYEEAGWDLALGEPRHGRPAAGQPQVPSATYPTLTGLQRAAERVVAEIGYSQRVTDDVLGFIRVRLASLRHGTTGRFLEGGHPLDFGALLRANVVLEIEDVGDDADKAFLMGAVLIRLAEHLRLTRRAGGRAAGLAHLTVVEEAHRLLRRPEPGGPAGAGAAGHAVELFAGLLAEIRAYGEGLVIAEQIPGRLVPDVIKNTAVKITHRLPAADDREAVGATMNATPRQSRYLVTLPPGQAAVFSDGMDFPVLVQVKDGSERELASTGGTADARTVVRARSGSCGGECLARPCTLREMRGGQRLLDDEPLIRLWAELAVLAHLTGWPMPVPVPDALAACAVSAAGPGSPARPKSPARPGAARLAQCALAHAVDAAVAARPPIAGAGALAAHVAEAIRCWADHREWRCSPDEPQWLIGAELPEEVIMGVTRPAVLAAAGTPGVVSRMFIDCQWALDYLGPRALARNRPGWPTSAQRCCARCATREIGLTRNYHWDVVTRPFTELSALASAGLPGASGPPSALLPARSVSAAIAAR